MAPEARIDRSVTATCQRSTTKIRFHVKRTHVVIAILDEERYSFAIQALAIGLLL